MKDFNKHEKTDHFDGTVIRTMSLFPGCEFKSNS